MYSTTASSDAKERSDKTEIGILISFLFVEEPNSEALLSRDCSFFNLYLHCRYLTYKALGLYLQCRYTYNVGIAPSPYIKRVWPPLKKCLNIRYC